MRLDAEVFRQFFGTRLTPVSFDYWLQRIARLIEDGQRQYLSGHHNLHSLYLLRKDASVRKFYKRCDDCYVDGMAVRLPLAGAGAAIAPEQRFSLMDTFPSLLEFASQQSWKIYYLGSKPDVVARAQQRLATEYPNLRMALHHGFFDNDQLLVEEINTFRPHILLVGMGMPRQESWLLEHIDKLEVVLATQAGATLDYFAGAVPSPPQWMSKMGLAWCFRLATDPIRLWRRYLIEPWSLLIPTVKLCLQSRRSAPLDAHGE